MDLKRKLVAILVADIAGYSRLVATDEESTLRQLEIARGIVREAVKRHDGRIFNTAGDALLAEFPSAVEAVRCALDVQARTTASNEAVRPARRLLFRIGISVGDVVESEGDLLGNGVNVAARLQTLAPPGGICVSSWVCEACADKVDLMFTDLGDQTVKNLPRPIRAFAAIMPSTADPEKTASDGVSLAALLRVPELATYRNHLGIAAILAVAGIGFALVESRLSRRPAQAPEISQSTPAPRPATPAPKSAASLNDLLGRVETVRNKDLHATQSIALERLGATPANSGAKSSTANASGPAGTIGAAQPQSVVIEGPVPETAELSLESGARLRECPGCPVMVVLPRGELTMGSPSDEPGRDGDDEGPLHKVTIKHRLAMAATAVTLGQFEAFIAASGTQPPTGCRVHDGSRWVERADLSYRNPGFVQTPDHPVVCINWNDAKAYAAWLARQTGRPYRLPSEAEREYAARAGTTTPYWWGTHISPEQARYDAPQAGTRTSGTVSVQSFAANPWGLHQVHGNVSEWVEDCWNATYKNAPADGSAWLNGNCQLRVLRGGSWGHEAGHVRAAYRENAAPGYRNFSFGFRVARDVASAP